MKNKITYTKLNSKERYSDFLDYLDDYDIREVAIDFELECNRHYYGNKVCLIQVYDGKRFFIIDPFTIDKNDIKIFLENKKIMKIGFSLNSDIKVIYEDLGIKMNQLYDIEIISNVIFSKQIGLDKLLLQFLNIEIKNKEQYQTNNWVTRPIRNDAIEYALSDVAYLFSLRDKLLEEAVKRNLTNKVIEAFIAKEWNFEKNTTPSFFSKQSYKMLSDKQKSLCKLIYEIREEYARSLNTPAINVFTHDVLINLVKSKKINNLKIPNKKIPENIKIKIEEEIKSIL